LGIQRTHFPTGSHGDSGLVAPYLPKQRYQHFSPWERDTLVKGI